MPSQGAPSRLDPPAGVVQAWIARVTDAPDVAAAPWSWLTEDERQRAARFYFEPDQRRFGTTRGLLRGLLGVALGTHPADVTLVEGAFGKPHLDPRHGARDLHFNVSHSGDFAVLALTRSVRVGVDIELMKPSRDLTHLAHRVFHPDEIRLLEGSQEPALLERFYRIWARKEAAAKALGRGIGTDFTSFSAWWGEARGGTCILREVEGNGTTAWQVRDLELVDGYTSAVAFDSPDLEVRSAALEVRRLVGFHEPSLS